MTDVSTKVVSRTKTRRNRWMPGERVQRAGAVAKQVLGLAAQITPGFLLSYADLLGVPSGFHAAWLAALAVKGESPLWAGAGCLLAFVMRLVWGLPPRLEMLVTLGLMLVAPVLLFGRGQWLMMGWTALALTPVVVAAAIGGTAADVMLGFACVLVGAFSAPVLLRALKALDGDRPVSSLEDRVAVGYLAGAIVCGGGCMLLFGVNLGVLGAALMTLGMAMELGVAAGTIVGLASGMLLTLQGLPVEMAVGLAVGGFMAGMVQALGRRWLSCVSFAAASILTSLATGVWALGGLAAVGLAALAMLLPRRAAAEAIRGFFRRFAATATSPGDAYAAAALADWEKTVEAMAMAVPSPTDDEDDHTGTWWKERLCAGCPDDAECTCMIGELAVRQADGVWRGRQGDEQAWQQALEGLRGLGCARLYHLRQTMDELRAGESTRLAEQRRMVHQRNMLVTHLTAMAGAARRFAQLASGESWWDDVYARQLRHRLSEAAAAATLMYARRVQGHAEVLLELHSAVDAPAQAEALCELARDALDTPMSVARVEQTSVLLAETPLWRIDRGMAGCGMEGRGENGDTWWLGNIRGGRYLAALSDGMGHGKAARRESTQTVTLLRLCLEAGYTRQQTLTAVNGMMLLAGRGERFSTVDLLTIDLWTGHAALDKLGAASTRLLRGRCMTELTGDALPLGILEEVDARSNLIRLQSGDELVLMTDGVEDAFRDKSALEDAIREAMSEATLQAAADRMLKTAREACGGGRQDDMSVVILRAEKIA